MEGLNSLGEEVSREGEIGDTRGGRNEGLGKER
jgi:hypothetical protein